MRPLLTALFEPLPLPPLVELLSAAVPEAVPVPAAEVLSGVAVARTVVPADTVATKTSLDEENAFT